MSRTRKIVIWLLGGMLLGLALTAIAWHQRATVQKSDVYKRVTLLIPDAMEMDAAEVRIWEDAANERGVLLHAERVTQWMRGVSFGGDAAGQAVIVPDTFHRQMTDAAIDTVYKVVKAGGKAMIVQDGGLLNERSYYQDGPSRFSQLVGVEYGDYHRWKEDLSYYDEVRGAPEMLEKLGIPPGRHLTATQARKLSSIAREDLERENSQFPNFVSGYTRESQRFAVFKTDRPSLDHDLLESNRGEIVASVNGYGKGQALFVNLPLTYLVERTDGIFLHGFLNYFATEMLGQPKLLNTPKGKGALILNWHNDDRKAITLLHTLQNEGIFDHGHQSMHFTAGPDVNVVGDGLGMDLTNNPEADAMVDLLRQQGHAIGNHGGWIHNYFGAHANDKNGKEYVRYLDLNDAAVTRADGGHKPREYSAPVGNQPIWVYDWFAKNNVVAYYTDANVGMPPTRTWIAKYRVDMAWGFPVLTYGQVASAEEASFKNMPIEEFDAWLQQIAEFIERQRTMRLSYFHPLGAVMYLPAVKNYIETMQRCTDRDKCQFISMTEAADFLTRREQIEWILQPEGSTDILTAEHPESLDEMTWSIPKSQYSSVRITEGAAQLSEEQEEWLVRAGKGKVIIVTMERKPPPGA